MPGNINRSADALFPTGLASLWIGRIGWPRHPQRSASRPVPVSWVAVRKRGRQTQSQGARPAEFAYEPP